MIFEAIILGILQGLTEFLPISSSGHLILMEWATGWTGELMNNLTFDVALHVGTLVAVLWYFWRDWMRFGTACINVLRGSAPDHEARLVWYIVLATIPAGVIGMRYEHAVETLFRNPLLVAAALVAGSIVMWLADRYSKQEHRLASMTLAPCFLCGACPGSRPGTGHFALRHYDLRGPCRGVQAGGRGTVLVPPFHAGDRRSRGVEAQAYFASQP